MKGGRGLGYQKAPDETLGAPSERGMSVSTAYGAGARKEGRFDRARSCCC